MFQADSLRQALGALGAVLTDRGLAYEVVVVGGGALLLVGGIRRPTRDVDALAIVEHGRYQLALPLPEPLREAIEDTALVQGLAPDWFNPGPTRQLEQGLRRVEPSRDVGEDARRSARVPELRR